MSYPLRIQDDIHHSHSIGDGNLAVAVDIGGCLFEVFRRIAQNLVHDGHNVRNRHVTVAIGVALDEALTRAAVLIELKLGSIDDLATGLVDEQSLRSFPVMSIT